MKNLFLLLSTASLLLACNREDVKSADSAASQGVKSIYLDISQSAMTKSTDAMVDGGSYSIISSGVLFFYDDSDEIVLQRELTEGEIDLIQNASDTSTSGVSVTIDGVPSTATSLRFVANVATATADTYPQVEDELTSDARLRVDLLQDDISTTAMSGLSGEFTLDTDSYIASVEITPLAARIEIGSITYSSQSDDSTVNTDFTSFNLAGIYINNIYPYVKISGEPYSQGTLIDVREQDDWDDEDEWSKYFVSNAQFPYYSSGSITSPSDWSDNALVDYDSSSLTGTTFYPSTTTTTSTTQEDSTLSWAYQVVPNTATDDGATELPHIILKLSNISYVDSSTSSTTRYVTVANYKSASGSSITSFKGGNIYRITSLEFSNAQATDKPYVENISVTATVTVTPWVVSEITPDWSVN
ncbi:MAG: hypothetical protein SNJ33_04655 [Rikenellaceae bacterium]